ncbi:Peptide deformylase [Pseudomonas syringae pv. actinidiae]|uniref:Peptide deformylase n=1 Tax=Pseudomonas syringae pv. actinidiae TaxID=103796 RepID=A0A2V0QHR5_PSESF|nr:Peptide deformylase [Pseudomonas syringae pv. actinidiae]
MLAGHKHLDHFVKRRHAPSLINKPRQQQPELTVERIDLTDRLDAWMVLGHPTAVAQSGFSGVASACVNLRQTKAHCYDS